MRRLISQLLVCSALAFLSIEARGAQHYDDDPMNRDEPSPSAAMAAADASLSSAIQEDRFGEEDREQGSEDNLSFLLESITYIREVHRTLSKMQTSADSNPDPAVRLAQQSLLELSQMLTHADHKLDPVLMFQYGNLAEGLKDNTSTNYDHRRGQYYDCDPITGVFPFQQVEFMRLNNQPGTDLKLIAAKVNTSRAAYDRAYQNLKQKKARYERKCTELADVDDGTEQLTESVVFGPPPNEHDLLNPANLAAVLQHSKNSSKQGILQRAQQEVFEAEQSFKKIVARYLLEHPKKCTLDESTGERAFTLRTQDNLEKKFIYRKPIELVLQKAASRMPPEKLVGQDRVQGFKIKDLVDIRIGIHMLHEWLLPQLGREHEIFIHISALYMRDLLKIGLEDWWHSTTKKKIESELGTRFPSPSYARFQMPTTYNEETVRILRGDALGKQLRKLGIVRYAEPNVSRDAQKFDDDLDNQFRSRLHQRLQGEGNEKFSKIYCGPDILESDSLDTVHYTYRRVNASDVKRAFSFPLPTVFLFVKQRRFSPADDSKSSVDFFPPPMAKMAEYFISPETLRFHRVHWLNVMSKLGSREQKPVKPYSPAYMPVDVNQQFSLYVTLCARYATLVKKVNPLQKEMHVSNSLLLPAPIQLFFTQPKIPEAFPADTHIDLSKRELNDEALTTTRPLPDGTYVPVLHSYITIDLSENNLQTPCVAVFSSTIGSLNLSRNRLTHFNIESLPWLIKLNLSHNPLKHLSALGLTEDAMTVESDVLVEDDLVRDFVPIEPDAVLKGNQCLQELALVDTGLSQADLLGRFKALRLLDISRNSLRYIDITPLALLEELMISDNMLESLQPFSSLPKLRRLNIAGNHITSCDSLNSTSLTELDVSRSGISTLMPLASLTQLVTLKANNTNCVGRWNKLLPPLAWLTTLELQGNLALDFAPFESDIGLSIHDVKNNDVTFQATYPRLRDLYTTIKHLKENSEVERITLSELANPIWGLPSRPSAP